MRSRGCSSSSFTAQSIPGNVMSLSRVTLNDCLCATACVRHIENRCTAMPRSWSVRSRRAAKRTSSTCLLQSPMVRIHAAIPRKARRQRLFQVCGPSLLPFRIIHVSIADNTTEDESVMEDVTVNHEVHSPIPQSAPLPLTSTVTFAPSRATNGDRVDVARSVTVCIYEFSRSIFSPSFALTANPLAAGLSQGAPSRRSARVLGV